MAVGMFAAMREALSMGPRTAAELFEVVDLADTRRQISKALYEMQQRGQVERLGEGYAAHWGLTAKGQRLWQDDDTADDDEPILEEPDATEPEAGEDDDTDRPSDGAPDEDEGEELPVNPVRPLASPFRELVESADERPLAVRPAQEEVHEALAAAAAHAKMVLDQYIQEHEDSLLREIFLAAQRQEEALETFKAWVR